MSSDFSSKSNTFSAHTIPHDTDIVFVSDLFIKDHIGGAELTTDALIRSSDLNITKIYSKDVTLDLLERGHKKYWIFGNFSGINPELIPSIIANMSYSVIEYDYKFCKYRSPEKHKVAEGSDCDCKNQMTGKLISAFYHGARSVWWMSEAQQGVYYDAFPFLDTPQNTVLSSVFSSEFFEKISALREKYKDHKKKKWAVLGSNSWIKGTDTAKKWCEDNEKDYEVLTNLPYAQMLEKLAQSQGLVFLPQGKDTCPRIVIEAKLLNCEIVDNENVQHSKEAWFDTERLDLIEAYLSQGPSRFWNGIKNDMKNEPTISGYTTTLNCIENDYPFIESITSMLGFCEEVVVVDGGSTDGTWEELKTLATQLDLDGNDGRLVIHKNIRDWNNKRFAVYDGEQKAVARSFCTKDFCWQQDADEVVHERDYLKVRNFVKQFPGNADIVALPVIEYWGGPGKIRVDVNPWKWRLSRNRNYITHGIPGHLRVIDEDGSIYANLGTDGCDYIHKETHQVIPHSTFYTQEVDNLRRHAMSNQEALTKYQEWFNAAVDQLPGVHHYSWFNLERKIRTYKTYWSRHWQSLYDIEQEDTPENNMFFQKKWSEVTDKNISELADRLGSEMGGWIFHSPVNFDAKTPHITSHVSHPQVTKQWIDRNTKNNK